MWATSLFYSPPSHLINRSSRHLNSIPFMLIFANQVECRTARRGAAEAKRQVDIT